MECRAPAYAQKVAEQYRTRHHVEEVDPDDVSLVDRLASVYDEPYADHWLEKIISP